MLHCLVNNTIKPRYGAHDGCNAGEIRAKIAGNCEQAIAWRHVPSLTRRIGVGMQRVAVTSYDEDLDAQNYIFLRI